MTHYAHPIMADLETHFKIFVSDIILNITTTKERFNWYVHLLPSIWTYTPKHVLTQQELLVPYITQRSSLSRERNFYLLYPKKPLLSQNYSIQLRN